MSNYIFTFLKVLDHTYSWNCMEESPDVFVTYVMLKDLD